MLNRCWHASQVYLDTYATKQHSFGNERISKRTSDRKKRNNPQCISGLSANQKRKELFRFVNHPRENVSGGQTSLSLKKCILTTSFLLKLNLKCSHLISRFITNVILRTHKRKNYIIKITTVK